MADVDFNGVLKALEVLNDPGAEMFVHSGIRPYYKALTEHPAVVAVNQYLHVSLKLEVIPRMFVLYNHILDRVVAGHDGEYANKHDNEIAALIYTARKNDSNGCGKYISLLLRRSDELFWARKIARGDAND